MRWKLFRWNWFRWILFHWILVFAALGYSAASIAEDGDAITYTPYTENQKIVFELYFDHPEKINTALYWLKAVFTTLGNEPYGYPPDFFDIKVVIHGTEIAALAKKNYYLYSEAVERMRYYSEFGVEFKVCSLSAHEFGYSKSDLPDFVELIPSAVTELVHWQSQGYALVVPKVWEKKYSLEEIR
jgi:intracellular sulfur oxidation DsrE/DsrF family protein